MWTGGRVDGCGLRTTREGHDRPMDRNQNAQQERQVAQLPPREQERMLSFPRALANAPVFPHTEIPPGTPGHIAAQLRVSPEAGAAMEQALEGTERIDPDE
jgi:hypothetical protein